MYDIHNAFIDTVHGNDHFIPIDWLLLTVGRMSLTQIRILYESLIIVYFISFKKCPEISTCRW